MPHLRYTVSESYKNYDFVHDAQMEVFSPSGVSLYKKLESFVDVAEKDKMLTAQVGLHTRSVFDTIGFTIL